MISAVIIDDEKKGITILKELLKRHCPQVEIAGFTTEASEGVNLVKRIRPELVFLDIEMPGINGFELLKSFDEIFFEKHKELPVEDDREMKSAFSAKGMRAALFIMLYRDFPVFQTSYQILDALVETDHQMATWRHKHLVMVRRMIGLRMGTGNTSGRGYLEGALYNHYIFKDIARLSTFLIERKKLPKLPVELIRKLSYN